MEGRNEDNNAALLATMRSLRILWRAATPTLARGLRDTQIMLTPLQQQQREEQRNFERRMTQLANRAAAYQEPEPPEQPEQPAGSHRLLHRRNPTSKPKQLKPSKLTFMRI